MIRTQNQQKIIHKTEQSQSCEIMGIVISPLSPVIMQNMCYALLQTIVNNCHLCCLHLHNAKSESLAQYAGSRV
jgi:hypothetical protein